MLTDGLFVLDELSVSKFISRRKVDGFFTKFPQEMDWSLYFRSVSWDAYFKMASRKESASLKVVAKKKGKTNKKLTWTDQDTDVFSEVISDIPHACLMLFSMCSSTIATLRVPPYWF